MATIYERTQLPASADVCRFNTATYKMTPELWRDLLTVLEAGYGFKLVATMDGGRVVRDKSYRWWLLTDNGGEMRTQLVNLENPDIPDVPLTWWSLGLDAGTIAYRAAMQMKGEPVDYDLRCPELVAECAELLATRAA